MLPLKNIERIQSSNEPASLTTLPFSSNQKILILAPHPDDFDEVAVTLRYFFKAGHSIQLLVLTGASSGVLDSFVKIPTKLEKENIREKEQLDALKFFGLMPENVQFLRLPEDPSGELILDRNCRQIVGKAFQEFTPDVVSLPYGKDTNISHQRTFDLFIELASKASKPVLGLCHRDPKTTKISIQGYFPFDQETARWKGEMLRFHQSQHTRNLQTRNYGIDDRILKLNGEIARELGIPEPYAEGFQFVVIADQQGGSTT